MHDDTGGGEGVVQWAHENLIIPELKATSSTDVIRALGGLLHEQGYVRDTYVEAAIEREKIFATGLPTSGIQVAIPHTDPEHVVRSAIAIGVPETPVEFGEMGNPDGTVKAQIICMLAVMKSETLVSLLQNLVALFQDEKVLRKIVTSTSAEQIAEIFNERIQ